MFIRHQGNQSLILGLSTLGLLIGATATPSFGYGFYQLGNGRQDYSTRYDLTGQMWPTQAGSPLIYDFGNIGGFDTTDPNIPDFFKNIPNITTAVVNAGNDWEPWANIKFGDALGASGSGLVRLSYNSAKPTGAATSGYTMARGHAEIKFGQQASVGVPWDNQNFEWIVLHELGHVIGLDDLYFDYVEEFVDHPVMGNPVPDLRVEACKDNVMNRINGNGGTSCTDNSVNDYSKAPTTVIDNDEIAGVTWLWGSKYNQIVTGDLKQEWNTQQGRDTEPHHGDQDNPLTWWDYRGSIVSSDGNKPYIDVEFPGYELFLASLYPNAPVIYGGNQGGSIERFIIDHAGWVGNFELFLKSEYSKERRVRAWVNGGQEDKFVLPINTQGLVDGSQNRSWPVVFGPTGPLRKDFGDAPESYITLLDPLNPNDPSKGGPRYGEGNFQGLGSRWDSEPDGQPTPLANGDDVNLWGIGGPDDEDGVIFGDSWVDVIFNISRPDPNPYQLRAWWDTNYNGVFDHTSELYIDDLLTLAPGIFTKRYNLGFNPKADGLYSRFRLTWDPLDLDVKPFGEYYSKADCNTTDAAAGNCDSHGEVEDYVHVPEPIPEPSSIFGLLAFTGLGLIGLRKKR